MSLLKNTNQTQTFKFKLSDSLVQLREQLTYFLPPQRKTWANNSLAQISPNDVNKRWIMIFKESREGRT